MDDHKILLLEAAPDKTEEITSVYSNRVSNITPGSQKLLESKPKLDAVSFIETTEVGARMWVGSEVLGTGTGVKISKEF